MNHNLDIALVGNNYLTYLLALGLLEKGRKILILDDKRFNYGEKFTDTLSYLDVEFLKSWGDEDEIAPLKNIESYIQESPFTLLIGKKQVLLGRSAYKNFKELKRKFSFIFNDQQEIDEDEMNDLFENTVTELRSFLIKENKKKKISDFIDNQIDERLKVAFNCFYNSFKNADSDQFDLEEKNDFQTLIFTTRGLYQNRLGSSAEKSEGLHLFLSLLSPNFTLKHEMIKTDLLKRYQEKGGELKTTNLDKLNSSNGIVERFAIESVEGMIRPRKMIFIGGYPSNLPVKLDVKKAASYRFLKVSAKFNNKIPAHHVAKSYTFSSSIKIGTDRPFWQAEFLSETEANFFVVMNYKQGSKVEFFKSVIENILCDDLKYSFAEMNIEMQSTKMSFTHDVLVDDRNIFSYKNNKVEENIKKTKNHPLSSGLGLTRARHALYLGTYSDNWLGRYSSLLELRRWKECL